MTGNEMFTWERPVFGALKYAKTRRMISKSYDTTRR